MGKSPLVSVLMTVYNGELFLASAIESILLQTLEDFEFIIINDGSTDRSDQILTSYEKLDPRIRVYKQRNQGLIASLNKGMLLAKGKYIARMDADDISSALRLDKQVNYMEKQQKVGVLGTQMNEINSSGELIGHYRLPSSHNVIALNLLLGRSFAHPSVMIRKTVMEWARGYNPEFPHAEDYELWTRLIQHTEFANLSELLISYRKHDRSICSQYSATQHHNVLSAKQIFVSRLLEKEVSLATLGWLQQSQTGYFILEEWQIEQLIVLINDYSISLQKKGLLKKDGLGEFFREMANRIALISRCTKRCVESIPASDLSKAYWKSLLPTPFVNTLLLAKHPRRVVSRLKKKPKRKSSEKKWEIKEKVSEHSTIVSGVGINTPKKYGITVVVLSYERIQALQEMLQGLLMQKLGNLETEIIICNNSPRFLLSESGNSGVSRLLRTFPDVKIFNSSYNWRCGIRYALAGIGKYETILFIDDDITLLDSLFCQYMFDTFKTLRTVDLISCWTTLWLEWNERCLSTVSLTFTTPGISELTECDTCGPGICMFNRSILLKPDTAEIVLRPKFPRADDMGFSLVASLESGSRRFYLPSYGMLKFHEEHTKNALYAEDDHYDDLLALYKNLLNKGYRPVLTRQPSVPGFSSPELKATRILSVVEHAW